MTPEEIKLFVDAQLHLYLKGIEEHTKKSTSEVLYRNSLSYKAGVDDAAKLSYPQA